MPAMTAFVTGHHHAALAAMTRYGTKELQVSESLNSMAFPFFALFGRAGSTMVASATFTAIILSYSNISLAAVDVLWIIGTASIAAFALGAAPGGGVTAALAILAMSYRDSLKESYLVVEPILPLLIALGAAADVLINGALVVAIDTPIVECYCFLETRLCKSIVSTVSKFTPQFNKQFYIVRIIRKSSHEPLLCLCTQSFTLNNSFTDIHMNRCHQ